MADILGLAFGAIGVVGTILTCKNELCKIDVDCINNEGNMRKKLELLRRFEIQEIIKKTFLYVVLWTIVSILCNYIPVLIGIKTFVDVKISMLDVIIHILMYTIAGLIIEYKIVTENVNKILIETINKLQ